MSYATTRKQAIALTGANGGYLSTFMSAPAEIETVMSGEKTLSVLHNAKTAKTALPKIHQNMSDADLLVVAQIVGPDRMMNAAEAH